MPDGTRDPADSRALQLGPRWLYPLKAAITRSRSLLWLAGGARSKEGFLRILFYHRVSEDADELAVTPARFRSQMEFLAASGLRGVDVTAAWARYVAGEPPSGLVGLSFDDGYLDVAETALPILAELGFSATVFVSTGVTEGDAAFTWYEAQPALIGWERMAELDREGTLRFEAHTITHPNLLTLSDEEARNEIEGSKAELERRLGREVTAFSYPAGLFGEREKRLVAAAGYRVAVSCEPGGNTRDTDPLALHRIQIDHRDAAVDFRAKAGGGHDRPPAARALWRRVRYGVGSPRSESSRA
jgi:peptidoglycan/xylan/chitin deacetylase (PgdA/CDA1 family)